MTIECRAKNNIRLEERYEVTFNLENKNFKVENVVSYETRGCRGVANSDYFIITKNQDEAREYATRDLKERILPTLLQNKKWKFKEFSLGNFYSDCQTAAQYFEPKSNVGILLCGDDSFQVRSIFFQINNLGENSKSRFSSDSKAVLETYQLQGLFYSAWEMQKGKCHQCIDDCNQNDNTKCVSKCEGSYLWDLTNRDWCQSRCDEGRGWDGKININWNCMEECYDDARDHKRIHRECSESCDQEKVNNDKCNAECIKKCNPPYHGNRKIIETKLIF